MSNTMLTKLVEDMIAEIEALTLRADPKTDKLAAALASESEGFNVGIEAALEVVKRFKANTAKAERQLREHPKMLAALQAWDKSEQHMAKCRHCSAGRPCSPKIVTECQEASRTLQSTLLMVEADLQ